MPILVKLLEPLGEGKPVPVFEREPFMTDQRLITVTILSDSSLLFLDDAKTTKKKKGYVRQNDIEEHLQRMLPYKFNLRIRCGATAAEYVDEMRDLTGTVRDPNDEELSAAREGRRKRQPGEAPKAFISASCFGTATTALK